MQPLDSKTKSGKLIDEIIARFPGTICVKENLFLVSFLPTDPTWKQSLKDNFVKRRWFDKRDVVVLLGGIVHRECPELSTKKIIKAKHPAAIWSKKGKEDYVNDIDNQIKALMQ